jgi:hypothetical protein
VTNIIFTFAGTAAALVFWELVKRVGVRLTEAYAPPAVAAGLVALDRLLPQLLAEGVTGDQVEQRLRQEMGRLTGNEWLQIKARFDPAIFLDHQSND